MWLFSYAQVPKGYERLFYAALEEFLFENSEFDSERAQSIALYLCLTAKEPAPEDMEEMKKLAEEFGL